MGKKFKEEHKKDFRKQKLEELEDMEEIKQEIAISIHKEELVKKRGWEI